ncbi:erythrocyte membrane protein 1, PfEMP1, putative [Plasmodium sp. gorilla clade G1]|nr:erythrocyte membrane protein 1, PfEMP1, putative [Plasmodium sp. gorilla clade G1]
MKAQGRGGGLGIDKDAKYMFDRIGKIVHDQVKNDAQKYIEELKGNLTSSTFFGGETAGTTDPCKLVEEYRSKANSGTTNSDPCGNTTGKEDVNRFSDTQGAECANNRIEGNNKNSNHKDFGACAPYRRLFLCNKNLEYIIKYQSNNAKHDLLAKVCYAAKHEGDSITRDYPKYDAQYSGSGSGSTMCTVLARSFADIGDIVRGKDLYLGKKKKKKTETERERDKIENNLKTIFGDIYKELMTTREKKGQTLQERYGSDTDFFQLREDWWTANRETVWKALTCNEELKDDAYFHATCSDERGGSQANHYCRCNKDKPNADKPNTDPPTYFDYVPQYLRWFEEWGEDFCRKKKKKLENLQKQCRGKYGDDGKDRYCSRNGYDCEKTVNARGKVRMGKGCTDCFFACNPYIDWINNQKEQFDKQRNKYQSEISGVGSSKKRNTRGNDYKGYEKKFYDELKNDAYVDVNVFLGLLNNEKACQAFKDDKGGKINFKEVNSGASSTSRTAVGDSGTNDENKGTFYRSKYCQPCPLCGVQNKGGTEWIEKHKSDECTRIKLYEPKAGVVGTPITILKSGEEQKEIAEKLKEFCQTENRSDGSAVRDSNSDSSLYEPWQCYQFDQLEKDKEGEDDQDYDNDVRTGGGLCILRNNKNKKEKEKKFEHEPNDIQKTFHDFFYYWVAHMLKDSIYWRMKKIKGCLENNNGNRCNKKNKCKDDCGCFQRWIGQKKKEWEPIKQHFSKQKNLPEGWTNYELLEYVLKLEFSNEDAEEKSQTDDEDAKETKHIKDMFEKKKQETDDDPSKENNIIDFLLDEEAKDAKQCIEKHTCPPPEHFRPGRSDIGPPPPEHGEESEEEEEEEEDHGPDDKGDDLQDEVEVVEETVAVVTDTSVEVCKIVDNIFKDTKNFEEACSQKYQGGKEKFPNWKCIPSDTKSVATGEGSSGNGDRSQRAKRATVESGSPVTSSSGATCIPPRRRKLYVTPLTKWVETQSSQSQAGGEPEVSTPATSSQAPNGDSLLTAFVESAAVETFFLWDRYKKENTKKPEKKKDQSELQGGVSLFPELDDEEDIAIEPDPEEELKTGIIPDDFLRQMFYTFGDYRDLCVGSDLGKPDDTINISDKVKRILAEEKNGKKSPDKWWNENAEAIWDGMVCALSYDTNEKKEIPDVRKNFMGDTSSKMYNYGSVTLHDGPISGTSLTEFASRPTFFRWLQEWGGEFCRKRTDKLKKLKKQCRGLNYSGNEKYCSGDGYDCKLTYLKRDDMFKDVNCPDCVKECRKYKKWIEKKLEQFDKQKNKYFNEREKIISHSNKESDKEFYENLKEYYSSAAQFFSSLKHCKPDQANEDKNNKLNFENPHETFSPSTYCKACPLDGVKCPGRGGCIPNRENNQTHPGAQSTEIDIIINDGATNDSDNKLHVKCKEYGLYTNLKKQKWKCQHINDIYKCELQEKINSKYYDDRIPFKILFERWIIDFIEGYNKSKEIITQCTKKSENKCDCVKDWLEIKKQEWEKIKNYYNENLKTNNEHIAYTVKRIFEQQPFDKYGEQAQKVVKCKDEQDKLWGCTGDNLKDGEKPENCDKGDFITQLIDKLKEKIGECKDQHSDTDCTTTPTALEEEPEELFIVETEENTANTAPIFCPETKEPPEEQTDEKCEEAASPDSTVPEKKEQEPAEKKDTEDQPPVPKPRAPEKKVEKPKQRRPIKPPYVEDPLLRPALVTSTLAWSVGIGFAAFTYFFLKKKTKSSVGNLFQILQIPKGDYDIPTLKSSNRYIPYASERYKGKTYIYMEGDSSGDEKYAFMSDTTDVTSSESEYEELDINDIYVPGSPKYKTLIEVVLEPSKRDTQNDIHNDIPSDIPNSDTPPPITDDEWNKLKKDFIFNMLQNTQNTEPNILRDNVDNNTHPTTSRHNVEEKPFIMSIHDINLFSGEEYNYDMFNSGNNPINISDSTNSMDSLTSNNHGPYNDKNDLYSGIDLINDALSGNHIDIYDEMLKRKENELFGTQHHPKNITSNRVVTQTSSDDPLHNQLNLFHQWLDRHRDMCEKWKNNHERLPKLKELWENETHSGDINSGIPSGNHVLNTDVSIQIDMNNPKYINQFTYVDSNTNVTLPSNPNLVENQNPNLNLVENNVNPNHQNQNQVGDTNFVDTPTNPTNVQIEMSVKNTQMMEENYPIEDVWYI